MSARVRIELCDVVVFKPGADPTLTSTAATEIWLAGDDGKIRRTRKPQAVLTADSRAAALRHLAGWIEQQDDPDLTKLAAEIDQQRKAATP